MDRILGNATHLEVNRIFSEAPFPIAFTTAEVPLPEDVQRPCGATNRFVLTPEVVTEVKEKNYRDWNNYDSEDPAFYHENILLLGTITHEDYVFMRLDEKERDELNSQGFNFQGEWLG